MAALKGDEYVTNRQMITMIISLALGLGSALGVFWTIASEHSTRIQANKSDIVNIEKTLNDDFTEVKELLRSQNSNVKDTRERVIRIEEQFKRIEKE